MTTCDQCRGPLFACDVLSGLTVCVECARKALRASRRAPSLPSAPPVAPPIEGAAADEYAIFVAAVRSSRRADGTVHQGDVRPLLRGRVAPKHIGTLYRRAKAEGLLRDTGEREPSNDFAGRNADKLDRIYAYGAAA